MGFDVGFNVPAGIMSGNIEFNKVYSIVKVLHDIQRCVLLHVCVARDLINLFC